MGSMQRWGDMTWLGGNLHAAQGAEMYERLQRTTIDVGLHLHAGRRSHWERIPEAKQQRVLCWVLAQSCPWAQAWAWQSQTRHLGSSTCQTPAQIDTNCCKLLGTQAVNPLACRIISIKVCSAAHDVKELLRCFSSGPDTQGRTAEAFQTQLSALPRPACIGTTVPTWTGPDWSRVRCTARGLMKA